MYILIYRKFRVKWTFFGGLLLCFISLLLSSFVPNEHYLFFTYSIPFGIGSSVLFVLGSLVTGIYFPPNHRYHVTASVAVSLGFPLGFLVLNPLTETLIIYYQNDWQIVQRIYAFITLIIILISCPLFTDKHAKKTENEQHLNEEIVFREEFLSLNSNHLRILIRTLWLLGLFLNSFANTSILIHLVRFF